MLKVLNKTPVRTSNNYGINDITLDINTINLRISNEIEIEAYDNEKLDIKIEKECSNTFNSKLGLICDKFYNVKIIVKENQILEKTTYIKYHFNNNDILVSNIQIVFEKNSKADFIIEYNSDENTNSINYLKQVNKIEENANANISIINLINQKSDNFIAVENEINENSKLNYNFIDLGGKRKISNYYTKLNGDFSENIFNNIYIGKDKDIIDMNYYIEQYGKRTNCNLKVQGALNGCSEKNFKGTIDFKEGSKKSIGIENENCVILSKSAKSKSLPILLCHEEDVQGAHGVSSGKIEEDKLFYIMSKGISKKDAERLIIKANFANIINEIQDENIRNKIIEIIEKKL